MIGLLYRAADALRLRALAQNHGRVGEDLAHRYLRRWGCTIIARNYRPRGGRGEIDLVAWHGSTLVFVEVKTRTRSDYGPPDRAVDAEKRERLLRGAREFAVRAHVAWEQTRFDIVSVLLTKPIQIDWDRDAFRRSSAAS